MSNAELFKKVFGICAEEFWAYPEEKMLDWLTSDVSDMRVGDTIYRQAAIDAINALHDKPNAWLDCAADAVMALPSAQPEQKRGHWINITNSNNYMCSECGRLLVNITDGKNNVAKNYPFCHCGAEMKGEDYDSLH